jgi:hypothetical protein
VTPLVRPFAPSLGAMPTTKLAAPFEAVLARVM